MGVCREYPKKFHFGRIGFKPVLCSDFHPHEAVSELVCVILRVAFFFLHQLTFKSDHRGTRGLIRTSPQDSSSPWSLTWWPLAVSAAWAVQLEAIHPQKSHGTKMGKTSPIILPILAQTTLVSAPWWSLAFPRLMKETTQLKPPMSQAVLSAEPPSLLKVTVFKYSFLSWCAVKINVIVSRHLKNSSHTAVFVDRSSILWCKTYLDCFIELLINQLSGQSETEMKRQMWKKILDFLMSAAVWVDKLGSFLLEGNILFSFNKVIPILDFFTVKEMQDRRLLGSRKVKQWGISWGWLAKGNERGRGTVC